MPNWTVCELTPWLGEWAPALITDCCTHCVGNWKFCGACYDYSFRYDTWSLVKSKDYERYHHRDHLFVTGRNNSRAREIRVEVYEQFNSIGKLMTLPQCKFSGISNHTWSNPDDNLMHYGNFIITPNYMHMYILYFKKLPTLSWKLAMVCLEKTDIPASGPEHRHTALPFENSFITIGHVENLPILHHFV